MSRWGKLCLCLFVFVYFFGGLECVGLSSLMSTIYDFLRDVWILTQSASVASWRATDLATHLSIKPPIPQFSHPSLYLATHKLFQIRKDRYPVPFRNRFELFHKCADPYVYPGSFRIRIHNIVISCVFKGILIFFSNLPRIRDTVFECKLLDTSEGSSLWDKYYLWPIFSISGEMRGRGKNQKLETALPQVTDNR